jgi:hypothetical protein
MALNIPIANSADLAGDRAVIARAEAIFSDVATASGDIETARRLPSALLDRLHDAQ